MMGLDTYGVILQAAHPSVDTVGYDIQALGTASGPLAPSHLPCTSGMGITVPHHPLEGGAVTLFTDRRDKEPVQLIRRLSANHS